MNTPTTLTFLGTADAVPEAGRDVASFVINGTHLVDTGWYGTAQMIRYGIDPLKIRTIILTHCHQDHYLGLPQFFFHWSQRWRREMGAPRLTMIGPRDLETVLEATWTFLMAQRHPEFAWRPDMHIIQDGETYPAETFTLAACKTHHPVDGRCYTFRDHRSGATIAFTGDTAYHEPIAKHVRGCDLLLHDATFAWDHPRHELAQHGHSTAVDAARIAGLARARRLMLLHYQLDRCDESLARAAGIFPGVSYAREGQTVEVFPDANP
jgi:ribonuclease Z